MEQNIFSCIGENVNCHGPLLLPFNSVNVVNRCYKLFETFTFLLTASQINSTSNQKCHCNKQNPTTFIRCSLFLQFRRKLLRTFRSTEIRVWWVAALTRPISRYRKSICKEEEEEAGRSVAAFFPLELYHLRSGGLKASRRTEERSKVIRRRRSKGSAV